MKRKYLEGIYEIIDNFEEYAYEVLPEDISERAIPSHITVKRMVAKKKIASEPRKYARERTCTRQNSGASVFINPGWEYCGVESFALKFLGWSKSKFEKAMEAEKCCRGDKWNYYTWFVPSSYQHLKTSVKKTQVNICEATSVIIDVTT